MLPIDKLSLCAGVDIRAGDLGWVIHRGMDTPWLAFPYLDHTQIVQLGGQRETAFAISGTRGMVSPFVRLDGIRMEVDEATAYTGQGDFPRIGDAFLCPEGFGIICRFPQVSTYILLSGRALEAEPEFGRGFVGFTSWRLVLDLRKPGEVFELASWTRPDNAQRA